MIKFLFKTLIIVVLLLIIIPLIMLLFGEGALVYKIFDWSFAGDENKQEVVVPKKKNSLKDDILNWVNEQVDDNDNVAHNGSASATVKNIYVDHNVLQDGQKGMKIEAEFDSKNLKGEILYCMVRFYNDDGSPLVQKKYNEKYRSVNGNVIVGDYTSPPYEVCNTKTPLFIPYDELPTVKKGRTDFILDASILYYTSKTDYEVLDRSRTYSFYIMND